MSTFLVEYDPQSEEVVEFVQYPIADRSQAQADRLEREKYNARNRVRHEVVLLEADSPAALLVTHGRYFKTLRELTTA